MKTPTRWDPRRLVLSFLTGTLLADSFPNIDLPGLAWLAPGLILWMARGNFGTGGFLAGFVAGLGNYLVSLYWLLLIPFPWHGLAAYLGLSIVMASYIGAWCWFCWRLWPARPLDHGKAENDVSSEWRAMTAWQRLSWPFLCAAAWVAMEMVAARLFSGFPWNVLGVSQHRWLALIQVASLGGVYAVSFLVAWLSVSLLCLTLCWSATQLWSAAAVQVLPPLLALSGCLFFGWQRLSVDRPPVESLKIALIQPAIPQLALWDSNERTNRLNLLLAVSRSALVSYPDLLVWPETALPDLVTRNRFTQQTLVNLLRPYQAWMAFGAGDFQSKRGSTNPENIERYNAAFLLNPAGEMVADYHKQHLVPFGEFMPCARYFPWLSRFRSAGAGLAPGERDVSFQMDAPRARFPALICYEDVFPHEVRRRVDADADFLLNLTNNGWFGESAAQWQHGLTALFRAIELGLPLVRCANNGLTCWIDARGRLHDAYFGDSKNIYQPGCKIIEVPLSGHESGLHPTLYRQVGDWFGWSCVAIVLSAELSRVAGRFRGSNS